MPPKKMEAQVAALESEVVSLRNVLTTMQSKAEENQEKLITMLEEWLTMSSAGKLVVEHPWTPFSMNSGIL